MIAKMVAEAKREEPGANEAVMESNNSWKRLISFSATLRYWIVWLVFRLVSSLPKPLASILF